MANFQDLATETRQQIFGYFTSHVRRQAQPHKPDYYEYSFMPLILALNKAIAREATSVFYGTNTYHYYVKQDSSAEYHILPLEEQRETSLPPLRKVHIHLVLNGRYDTDDDDMHLQERLQAICRGLSRCQGLAEVCYSVHGQQWLPNTELIKPFFESAMITWRLGQYREEDESEDEDEDLHETVVARLRGRGRERRTGRRNSGSLTRMRFN